MILDIWKSKFETILTHRYISGVVRLLVDGTLKPICNRPGQSRLARSWLPNDVKELVLAIDEPGQRLLEPKASKFSLVVGDYRIITAKGRKHPILRSQPSADCLHIEHCEYVSWNRLLSNISYVQSPLSKL